MSEELKANLQNYKMQLQQVSLMSRYSLSLLQLNIRIYRYWDVCSLFKGVACRCIRLLVAD